MDTPTIDAEVQDKVVLALRRCPLFRLLKPELVPQLLTAAEIVSFSPGETIVRQGEAADAFFVLAEGEATIWIEGPGGEGRELGRVPRPSSIGEVGLLLCETRTATVTALTDVIAAKFKAKAFEQMFLKIPGFGLGLSAGLALRLQNLSGMVPLPDHDLEAAPPSPETLALLPMPFIQRHRDRAGAAGRARRHARLRGRPVVAGHDGPARAAAGRRDPGGPRDRRRVRRPPQRPGRHRRLARGARRRRGRPRRGRSRPALAEARPHAGAGRGRGRLGPAPLPRHQAALARRRRHEGDRGRRGARARRRLPPARARDGGAAPRGAPGAARRRPRVRGARPRALPRERLPGDPRHRRRAAADPEPGSSRSSSSGFPR